LLILVTTPQFFLPKTTKKILFVLFIPKVSLSTGREALLFGETVQFGA